MINTFHFFVPYRLIWTEWADFWDEPYYDLRKTRVGATGQVVWFAHRPDGSMLRDKRGVGRRFKSEKAARTALKKAEGN